MCGCLHMLQACMSVQKLGQPYDSNMPASPACCCALRDMWHAGQMDQFEKLSLDELVVLLSHVDLKTRLSSCSLVSTTWRTTVTRATTSVDTCNNLRRYYDWCQKGFGRWLRLYSAKVQVTSLRLGDTSLYTSSSRLCLALSQLRSLKVLELGCLHWKPFKVASLSDCGLAPLTALTRLVLSRDSIWLSDLSALTSLQELTCNFCGQGDVWSIDLAVACPQLRSLTSLTLHVDAASTAVLQHTSSLPSLQRMELTGPAASSFFTLPESLTALSFTTGQAGSPTAFSISGICQLTALQSLHMTDVVSFNAALLAGAYNLRCIHLERVERIDDEALGLQALILLTALTALITRDGPDPTYWAFQDIPRMEDELYMDEWDITAAEAAALTSSSQLAELELSGKDGQLQAQAYASLFPPGRQLQHLTNLIISANLLTDPAVMRQACRCCANLRKVVLDGSRVCCFFRTGEPAEAAHEARLGESVAALSGCEGLHELCLQPWPRLPGPVWQALGALTQLTGLFIQLAQEPDKADVMKLVGARGLRRLKIDGQLGDSTR